MALAPYLDRLRELPFVRDVALDAPPANVNALWDALLKVETPRRTYRFAVELKRTYLDRALTNAVIAERGLLARKAQMPLLLLARYIPRPTGERLVEAGVNFVDRPGNIHLTLGDDHHVLLLGRREPTTDTTARRPGPALVQLYFLLLAEPAALTWPVRRLAEEGGFGKTTAAAGLRRLVGLGVLGRDGKTYRFVDAKRLTDDFLRGYAEVLRPHLVIGRFRPPERDLEKFLLRLAGEASELGAKWAVTGAPAAYKLDRFYRGDAVPVFVDGPPETLRRTLRLVPDPQGPVTLLRPFGERWKWRDVGGAPVAHPWLVYAELLFDGEPRALEAAEQFRERHLAS